MARYIDADKLEDWVNAFHLADAYWAIPMLRNAPTADVVPKSEVAREIFEDIDNYLDIFIEREYSFAEEEHSKGHYPEAEAHDYAKDTIEDIRQICIAELKKKYTEGTI